MLAACKRFPLDDVNSFISFMNSKETKLSCLVIESITQLYHRLSKSSGATRNAQRTNHWREVSIHGEVQNSGCLPARIIVPNTATKVYMIALLNVMTGLSAMVCSWKLGPSLLGLPVTMIESDIESPNLSFILEMLQYRISLAFHLSLSPRVAPPSPKSVKELGPFCILLTTLLVSERDGGY